MRGTRCSSFPAKGGGLVLDFGTSRARPTSAFGTIETCRRTLKTSAYGGRPEVVCAKKAPPRKEVVDVNAAILEVTAALTRGEAVKAGVTVGTQLAGELPRIQCDRVQLQQVMLNLIVNAIQSMSGVEDGNRELHISTVSIEPGVCVAVRDTGHGLRPESLPRLFEPFYTTKPDGMGMGLSICRSIIEAHGGRLWATRCEPRGALFQFTIPAD